MPRFHYPMPLSVGALVDLPEPLAHHLHVLRLTPGENITLFNGEGGAYTATLNRIEKKRASAEVKTFSPEEIELPYAIELAQALPEGAKMDWIIEKAVELGAAAVQPLAAQRSVVRLSAERAAKKREHWQGIVAAASEQCGRNRLMHLPLPVSLADYLAQTPLHVRILLTPRATQSLGEWARHHPAQAVSILIGPEGGFSSEEEDLAARHGVLMLGMGQRVLRTETAGLAAIAGLNAVWGEM